MTDDETGDLEGRVAEIKLALRQLTQEMQARAERRKILRGVVGPKKLAEFDARTQKIRDAIAEGTTLLEHERRRR
jgi:hypothetical protein